MLLKLVIVRGRFIVVLLVIIIFGRDKVKFWERFRIGKYNISKNVFSVF